MSSPASELIRRRYSCRAYRPEPIAAAQQRLLTEFMAAGAAGPLGAQARFALVAAAPGDDSALRRLGTYGFIKGATGRVLGCSQPGTWEGAWMVDATGETNHEGRSELEQLAPKLQPRSSKSRPARTQLELVERTALEGALLRSPASLVVESAPSSSWTTPSL